MKTINSLRYGAGCEKLVLISTGMYEAKPTFKGFVGLFGLDAEYYTHRLFDLAESIHGVNPGVTLDWISFLLQIETETLIVHWLRMTRRR